MFQPDIKSIYFLLLLCGDVVEYIEVKETWKILEMELLWGKAELRLKGWLR